jgi:hypothetical protein
MTLGAGVDVPSLRCPVGHDPVVARRVHSVIDAARDAASANRRSGTLRLCPPIAARYLLAGDYPLEGKMVRCHRFASVRRT